jgi:hypothetical protein
MGTKFDLGASQRFLHTHRGDGKRFVVRVDELLTAFLELESAIRACYESI